MKITNVQGATPLDPDTMQGLIPKIETQGELNQCEAENIFEAQIKYEFKKHKKVLEINFIFQVHKDMFDQVWSWAGQQRRINTNIGIEKENILESLKAHLDDTKFWLENKTYSMKEIAARFHHRLVQIHVFPNGNGRHARLMTDILMFTYNGPEIIWGNSNSEQSRKAYLEALKKADEHEFSLLINFMSESE